MILVDMRADREVEPRKRARYSSARMRRSCSKRLIPNTAVDERIEASGVRPGRVRGVDEYRFPVAHVDEGEP